MSNSKRRRKAGTVAAPHPLSAKAGAAILKAGGNAVDAAVATGFTSAVVDPASNGIAGYGANLVIYQASRRRVVAVDSNTVAPGKASEEMFEIVRSKNAAGYRVPGQVNVFGPRSVGVPGVVAGLCLTLRRYGTMSLHDVLQPAIRAARRGFVLTRKTREYLGQYARQMREQFPETARVHLVGARLPRPGERQRNPDLARTLEAIATEGPEAFYKGEVAAAIAAHLQEGGSCLTTRDLASYRARVVEPYETDYRGYRLFTAPLASGGLTTMQMLRLLEEYDLAAMTLADRFHHMAETMKVSWPERLKRYGDLDFVDVDTEGELSDAMRDRLKRRMKKGLVRPGGGRLIAAEPLSSTVHISTADALGNLVSLTQTHGGAFGSLVTVPGTGLLLGHGLGRFDPRPGMANSLQPGKAPLQNMSPFLALDPDSRPFATYGLPGGRTIPNNQLNFTISLIDLGRTPQQTVAAPRLHCEGAEPLEVERRAGKSALSALRKRGHRVEPSGSIGGPGHAIVVDGQDPAMQDGATDPRYQGAVAYA